MRNKLGQYITGDSADNRVPVGTERIRTRHKRNNEQRTFVKIADPNSWILKARFVWEQANGQIPRGMGIHHKNENKLDDALDNLELVSKARHLEIHMPEYRDRVVTQLIALRRERRWSTKSKDKRVGRPPTWDQSVMANAVESYRAGEGSLKSIGSKFGIPVKSLRKRLSTT